MTRTLKREQGRRLLQHIRLLSDKGPLTSAEVARQLGCTLQEVQRDRRLLRASGFEILETGERPPRYVFAHPWRQVNPGLDPVRAVIQHALLRLLHHHAPTPSRSYHDAALHLAGQLPARLQDLARQSLNPPAGDTPRTLETIAAAWCYGQPIQFTYQKPAGKPERGQAHVVFMEVNRTNLDWYVFCQRIGEKKVKTFHLSRFHEVTRQTTHSSPDIPFDPHAELDGAWGIIGGKEHCDITLRFDPATVPYVAHRPWPGQRRGEMVGQHYLLTVRASIAPQQFPLEVMAWIRSWGSQVEILSPTPLREAWLREAKEVVMRYGIDAVL